MQKQYSSYHPDAPCALCSAPSPESNVDLTIDKYPYTSETKVKFSNLPCCDECQQRNKRNGKIQAVLFLASILFFGIAYALSGWTFDFPVYTCGLPVGIITVATVVYMFSEAGRYKEIKVWAKTYAEK